MGSKVIAYDDVWFIFLTNFSGAHNLCTHSFVKKKRFILAIVSLMNGWMEEPMNKQTDDWMNRWMVWSMKWWINGEWTDEWKKGWMS